MVKKTYRHHGGLKPGSYFLIGKDNKAKNGNLSFEGIVGDFLVAKGLATTEDNCTYVLNCCEGTIDNIRINEEIEICNVVYPIGTLLSEILQAVVDCVTSGIVTVQTVNGISGDGSSGDKVRLGGALNQSTSITGGSTYSLTFSNLLHHTVTTDGPSAKGLLIVSGTQSQAAVLKHTKDSDANVYSQLTLDFNNECGMQYNDANGLIGFFIFPDEADIENELAIRTKGIRDGTKSNGMAFVLTDATTGKGEWSDIGASITFPGPYDDDTAAGVGGVALNSAYELSAANPYGMTEGVIKIRKT